MASNIKSGLSIAPRREMRPLSLNIRGFALIVVLSFITLLTVLLVAFLSRSANQQQILTSSNAQTRVKQLAKGAIELINSDLRQEIAAGSNTPDTKYNVSIYSPKSNRTIVPAIAYATDGTTPPPNVIKRSASGVPFFPTSGGDYNTTNKPSSYASASSSGSASYDGRSVPNTRWNTPCLMDSSVINSTTANGFVAPDWIIVTRGGPKPFTAWDDTLKDTSPSNTNLAIGRFAYVIYDEGGLLDVNVAGNLLNSTQNSRRGRLHQADLTQIPGLSPAVPALLGWRAAYSGSNNSAAPHKGGLFDPMRDFRQVENDGNLSGVSDQSFVSRQDLIAFLHQNLGLSSTNTGPLQYLGTFSRELNAPSFTPTNLPTATGTTAINPALTSVRFSTSASIIDETGTNQITAGTPLLRKRFPLGRLAWITSRGPSADLPTTDSQYNADGTDTNILNYFGLKVTGTTSGSKYKTWTYRPDSGGNPASSILTLQQVAALSTPRDPDFFELLKATILQGSVGQFYYGDSATASYKRDYNKDVHIMQIGANLLTQYCSDGQPTIISFTNTSANSSADFNTNNIRGIANFPYLYQLGFLVYRSAAVNPQRSESDGNIEQWPNMAGWIVPRFWNPHQWLNAPNTQLQFRMVANGGTWTWQCLTNTTFSPDPTNSTLTFKDSKIPTAANESIFAEPALIPSANLISGPTNGGLEPKCNETSVSYKLYGSDGKGIATGVQIPAGPSLDFAGIPFGITSNPDCRLDRKATTAGYGGARILVSGNTVFEMQYSPDGGATFIPYQRFTVYTGFQSSSRDEKNVLYWPDKNSYDIGFGMSGYTYSIPSGGSYTIIPTIQSGYFIDPRTPRLGMGMVPNGTASVSCWFGPNPFCVSYYNNNVPSAAAYNPLSFWYNRPYDNPPASGGGDYYPDLQGGSPGNTPAIPFYPGFYSTNYSQQIPTPSAPSMIAPIASQTTFYSDPDQIPRRGDGDDANDVHPTFTSAASYTLGTHQENSTFTQAAPSNRSVPRIEDRPLILNRPFVSVGELGYAFRDVPWRSLNFFSQDSADAGLLDVFSMDAASVVAGRVNLNTRQPVVLQSLLAGALRSELSGTNGLADASIDPTTAQNIANFVTAQTNSNPICNRSELATRIVASGSFPLSNGSDSSDYIKTRREAAVRALADAGQTRTWNLMIDVIAQTGRFPNSINGKTPNALSQFSVEGECRYWVHLAIDRYTGEIIDQQWEPVYE